MKVKVCCTQMSCSWNIDENIKKADNFIIKATKDGANIVLLQELFKTPYFCQKENYDYFSLAEDRNNSDFLKHFQQMAKKYNVVLPISFFEKDQNCFFNSIAIIDSDGKILGFYRKSHIPTGECYEEKFYFSPGDTGFKVFKTHFGNVGVGICWDQWFPECARIMALMGADFLFYPTAIGSEPVLDKDSRKHWQNVMIGHSAANIIPVIASNRVGKEIEKDSSMIFFGNSFITDEYGIIKEQLNDVEENYKVVEFDIDKIRQERISWGVFRDRRPDLYKDICKLTVKRK